MKLTKSLLNRLILEAVKEVTSQLEEGDYWGGDPTETIDTPTVNAFTDAVAPMQKDAALGKSVKRYMDALEAVRDAASEANNKPAVTKLNKLETMLASQLKGKDIPKTVKSMALKPETLAPWFDNIANKLLRS